MINLPDIKTKRIAVKLKPVAERVLKSRHPWIFNESIVRQSAEALSGDMAVIFDQKKNNFLALGLFDIDSPIRIKIIQFNKPETIDKNWFYSRIQVAYNKRTDLLNTDTNSYRLIFGENDGFPGLIADVYADVLVVKLYTAIWFSYIKTIFPILLEISKTNTLVLRLSRKLQQQKEKYDLFDGQLIHGDLNDEIVVFTEHGIRFSANVIQGHKTGYFLDHRHNRKRLGDLAKDKYILDVFAYAGGFSVHALAKGAKEVTSLDISAQALEMAKHNVALNKHNGAHHIIKADAFEGLQNLINIKKIYDIVVIDPPSFAKRKEEVPGAINSYTRLAKLGVQLVRKGGILVMASCSSRIKAADFFILIENVISKSNKKYTIIEKTQHDSDHPIGFPEAAYLKTIYFQF
jgi:23S rRNA (cytosine1962-C5)-methyltransferase